MGSVDPHSGLCPLLSTRYGSPPPPVKGVVDLREHLLGGETQPPQTGGGFPPHETGNRSGLRQELPRRLRQAVPCSKEKWQDASCYRPFHSEQIHSKSQVSDGDSCFDSRSSPSGGLGNLPRSEGRLFPRPHCTMVSQVPQILAGGPGLSVSGSLLRSIDGSQDLHPCVNQRQHSFTNGESTCTATWTTLPI